MAKHIYEDLFETPSKLPKEIKTILSRYNDLEIEKGIQYADLIQMGKELAVYGYEFDFYLRANVNSSRQFLLNAKPNN
jgi:hypothetical protein